MDSNKYDLFEISADGSPLWRCCVEGHAAALQEMDALAANCENEIRVVYLPTEVIVARVPAKLVKADAETDDTEASFKRTS